MQLKITMTVDPTRVVNVYRKDDHVTLGHLMHAGRGPFITFNTPKHAEKYENNFISKSP